MSLLLVVVGETAAYLGCLALWKQSIRMKTFLELGSITASRSLVGLNFSLHNYITHSILNMR